MAEATKGSAANRRRASASRGGSSRARGSSARSRSSRSRAAASKRRSRSVGVRRMNGAVAAAKEVFVPMASAAVGAAVGIVMERRAHRPRKKLLGIPVPGTGRNGLGGLAKEVRRTGEQFGNLASEVKSARQTAQKVGKAVS